MYWPTSDRRNTEGYWTKLLVESSLGLLNFYLLLADFQLSNLYCFDPKLLDKHIIKKFVQKRRSVALKKESKNDVRRVKMQRSFMTKTTEALSFYWENYL